MKKYYILGLVFVGSVVVTLAANKDGYVHSIAEYPALVALFATLGSIILDELRHQKEIRLSEMQAIQSLFSGGHFATQVYDRQLQFCEEYWNQSLSIVKELEQKAEFPELIQRANALYTFRMERAIWLTPQMNEGLEAFEKALRSLGVDAHVYNRAIPGGKSLPGAGERTEETFHNVLAIAKNGAKGDSPSSYLAVLNELQKVLGISEITDIRRKYLEMTR